jgi:hypothetical protein
MHIMHGYTINTVHKIKDINPAYKATRIQLVVTKDSMNKFKS